MSRSARIDRRIARRVEVDLSGVMIMAIRFDTIRSAILIGMLAACFTESACADYVVQSSDLGAIDQQMGSIYSSPGFPAFGYFGDNVNIAYAGFLIEPNYTNIQSITVSGNVSMYFDDEGTPFSQPTPISINSVSGQIAGMLFGGSSFFYYSSTYGAELFSGLMDGIPGLNGYPVIPEGSNNFSLTISDPVAIAETVAAAEANGGFIALSLSPNPGPLLVLNSASLEVQYGTNVSPQNAVPEPASLTLAFLGVSGISIGRRVVKRRGSAIAC